ncbi:MAG: YggS family pyridoxal phosphate-dependent enzyme [Desulfobulbaceae bacterium]|nr:YggS family pyridoxal phosphate-dependent enzyme [Candidatus Kapabacteria bacterium]MBS4000596.1 YggS family pyridoxal phosphate-dependent enzyme [Desulfobulbaceae bacterium]
MNERVELLRQRFDIITQNAEKAALGANRDIGDIKIIAVSKIQKFDHVADAVGAGLKYFGENYVAELREKHVQLTEIGVSVPEWHFIGHLQTNKVKYIAEFITMIHSVDSLKLAEEIDKRAQQHERVIDVLIQINTSGEESKSGIEPEDAPELAEKILKLKNVKLRGLMTIGTFTDDESLQRQEFKLLRNTLNSVNEKLGTDLKELSMGMTGDYAVAISEGATMVRIGTAIFGERHYD